MDGRKLFENENNQNRTVNLRQFLRDSYKAEGRTYNRTDSNDFVKVSGKEIEEEALKAARKATPHIFNLRRRDNKPAKVMITGCQGSGKDPQKRASELFDRIVREYPDGPPDCIIFLGDNVYDSGANSPNDEMFIKCFHEMYGKNFPHLAPIPCFMMMGNHDGNYHFGSYYNPTAKKGEEVEINQVAHHYLQNDKRKTVDEQFEFYNSGELYQDIYFDELSKYNMPSDFYSLAIDGMQFFCLNSNSYSKDYYDYKTNKNILPSFKVNQAQWYEREYFKARGCDFLTLDEIPQNGTIRNLGLINNAAYVRFGNKLYYVDQVSNTATLLDLKIEKVQTFDTLFDTEKLRKTNCHRELTTEEIARIELITGHHHGRKIIHNQHHPLYTCGKRIFYEEFDTGYYPVATVLGELQKLLQKNTVSFNDLSIDILMEQGIYPDLFNVAHDHFISVFNNKFDDNALYKFVQLTLGGGGQKTQARECFTGHPYVAQHIKDSGCAIIQEDPNDKSNLLLHVFAASKYPLVNNSDQEQEKELEYYKIVFSLKDHIPIVQEIDDEKVKNLRNEILEICNDYLNNLSLNGPKPDANTPNIPPSKPPKEKPNSYWQTGMTLMSNVANKISNGFTKVRKLLSHDPTKAEETIVIQNLLAFFNQNKIPDYKTCLKFLNEVMKPTYIHNKKETASLFSQTGSYSKILEKVNPQLKYEKYMEEEKEKDEKNFTPAILSM